MRRAGTCDVGLASAAPAQLEALARNILG